MFARTTRKAHIVLQTSDCGVSVHERALCVVSFSYAQLRNASPLILCCAARELRKTSIVTKRNGLSGY